MNMLLKSVQKTKWSINRCIKSEQTEVVQKGEWKSFGETLRTALIVVFTWVEAFLLSLPPVRSEGWTQKLYFHFSPHRATQLPNSFPGDDQLAWRGRTVFKDICRYFLSRNAKWVTERRCSYKDVLKPLDTLSGLSNTVPEECAPLSRGLWSASELHHDCTLHRAGIRGFLREMVLFPH